MPGEFHIICKLINQESECFTEEFNKRYTDGTILEFDSYQAFREYVHDLQSIVNDHLSDIYNNPEWFAYACVSIKEEDILSIHIGTYAEDLK